MSLPMLVHLSAVPRVSVVWEKLPPGMRLGLERWGLAAVSVFRACMDDGTVEEARVMMIEATGDEADVPLLQEMWALAAAGAAS